MTTRKHLGRYLMVLLFPFFGRKLSDRIIFGGAFYNCSGKRSIYIEFIGTAIDGADPEKVDDEIERIYKNED